MEKELGVHVPAVTVPDSARQIQSERGADQLQQKPTINTLNLQNQTTTHLNHRNTNDDTPNNLRTSHNGVIHCISTCIPVFGWWQLRTNTTRIFATTVRNLGQDIPFKRRPDPATFQLKQTWKSQNPCKFFMFTNRWMASVASVASLFFPYSLNVTSKVLASCSLNWSESFTCKKTYTPIATCTMKMVSSMMAY